MNAVRDGRWRAGKILGLLLGGLVLVFAGLLVSMWLWINPNDYKNRIAQAVKESTGRELRLPGDLKLSVFPWVAVQLGEAELGNPPGFEGTFIAVSHAAVRARLWPLLHGELAIGRIDLDGLNVRLQKNAAGLGNWQNLGRTPVPGGTAAAASSAHWLQGLDGLSVTHGQVSFGDLVAEQIHFETGRLVAGGVVPLSLSLVLTPGAGRAPLKLNAAADLSAEFNARRWRLAALDLNGALARKASGRSAAWRISAPDMSVDGGKDTLSLPAFAAELDGAHLSGALEAVQITQAPEVSGHLNLAPVDVREFLARLDLPVPVMRDPKTLTRVGGAADFSYGPQAARLGPIDLTVDDTRLRGEAALRFEPPRLSFNLTADRVDADRYLGPQRPDTPARTPAAAARAPAAHTPMPEADGRLTVESLGIAGAKLSNLAVTVTSRADVLELHPATADLYGGHYSGDIRFDEHGALPVLGLDEHLHGIDMAQLLAERFKTKRLSGRGNIDIQASATGAGSDAMLKTANGRLEAHLTDGALEGVDLGYQIGQAEALLRQGSPPAQNSGRTPFDSLKAAAVIQQGVATLKEFDVASPFLKITGGGTATLSTQALNLRLAVSLANPGVAGGLSLANIPVQVGGTAAEPAVKLDIEGLAKDQLRQKLPELLKDKLQGLFGK